jgi:response regulator RpfG family c-di-GMP phosphodiesterase
MSENESVALPEASSSTILCVDDEPGILSALRRLFRAKGFQVQIAEGGKAGLALMENQAFDLVISDMRMPEMDGAAFLEQVRLRWPSSIRLLLTGYADIQSVMAAINKGEIYRYIAKPWDDNDILLIVRSALQHRSMEMEQRRLQALISQQNEELKELNAGLEIKVQERTKDLQLANERLKNNFVTSIKVFTSLIELRQKELAGHSRRVADLAKRLAVQLGLDARQSQEIFVAGLLHEIGKVGFEDVLLKTPVVMFTTAQLESYRQFPERAEAVLMPFEELKGAVQIVRSFLERYDGTGHPLGLEGEAIPIGARILAVASDYDGLQIGLLAQRKLDPKRAQESILLGSGRRYDPLVVEAFMALYGAKEPTQVSKDKVIEVTVHTRQLTPGMRLSRDLITSSGLLMLTAGHVFDQPVIKKIVDFERSNGLNLNVEVWQTQSAAAQ